MWLDKLIRAAFMIVLGLVVGALAGFFLSFVVIFVLVAIGSSYHFLAPTVCLRSICGWDLHDFLVLDSRGSCWVRIWLRLNDNG